MPSRKQRRRREKLQRHEYEYVIETDEGEEILETPRALEKTPQKRERQSRGPSDRRGRPIQPPSVARVLKRGAIFGPLLLVVTYLTAPSLTTAQKIFNAVLLIMIFLPFSYLVDLVVYRTLMRQHRRQQPGG
ncbi:hypothetical protein BH18ACT14_BH18ACT14_06850 [soil metagenome]